MNTSDSTHGNPACPERGGCAPVVGSSVRRPLGVLGLLALLAGCEPAFDVDVAAAPPGPTATLAGDPVRISLPLKGVILRTEGGEQRRITRGDPALTDLLRFDGQSVFSLLSNRKIDDGRYRGVQLQIDADNAEVETLDGGLLPIDFSASPPFVPVAFSVKADSNERESLTLVVDLRLSLALRNDQRYQFDPVLRAVRNGDGAEISGTVAATLLTNPGCARGAAVYLFEGQGIEPDERDGVGVEPYATTPVLQSAGSTPRYRLRFLPAGAYTLALTCDGDREDGLDAAAEALEFGAGIDINLDESETTTRNL